MKALTALLLVALSREPAGQVLGRVVSSTDQTPVRQAVITLRSMGPDEARVVLSNDEGAFSFEGLPTGVYSLEVRKTGFLTAYHGSARPGSRPGALLRVTEGIAEEPVTVSLVSAGVIAGRVLNTLSRPASGVEVQLLRRAGSPLVDSLRLVDSILTDDAGHYRFGDVVPGAYVIGVSPLAAQAIDSRQGGQSERRLTVPLLFPNARRLAEAAVVDVAPGQRILLPDMVRELTATATLRGVARAADGAPIPNVGISVASEFAAAGIARFALAPPAVRTDESGRFEMIGLFPGTYYLTGRSEAGGIATWLQETVRLDAGNETQKDLVFNHGATIRGRVDPTPGQAAGLILRTTLPGARDVLRLSASIDPSNGQFRFDSVGIGHYAVEIVSAGRAPVSAISDGRDLLDTGINVTPSDRALELNVHLETAEGILAGRVVGVPDSPLNGLSAVIFPPEDFYWTPGSRRIRIVPLTRDGELVSTRLPPGDYAVALLAGVSEDDLGDGILLRDALHGAVRVRVAAGQTTRAELRIRGLSQSANVPPS